MGTPAPERWQRIEALIDTALETPVAEREAFLRVACGDDLDLYRDVVRLLEAGERPDAFLAEPVANLAARVTPHATPPVSPPPRGPIPVRIGAYRIVRELGRGGMGTVYLAEREEHFQQSVALKVIRYGLHMDEPLVRRFIAERQMVASLEHANIARLLDGGVTDEGVPWFAMELVEGEPIDRWCDDRRLSTEARLELFGTVCEAIEYAHRRQIIHRDIKPSNILVRGDGTVKLLDFGIAKLVAAESPVEASATHTGLRLLTPEYASPEQVRGDAVTAASDVYSLGVLLYELLTGRRPYRITGSAGKDVEPAALTQEPAWPSTVVKRGEDVTATNPPARDAATPTELARARGSTPDRLSERLRGELDGIVLKALARDVRKRYASVEALARDVRRHLDGQPVSARPPARVRPRALAITALLLLAVLVSGLWVRNRPVDNAPGRAPVLAVGLISDYRDSRNSDVARSLGDLLATNLARVQALRVVSTARMYELMAQMSTSGDADAGAYAAAARRAGASMLVDGSLYAVASGGLRLDLRRIDILTGDLLAAHTVSGDDVFALVDSGTVRLTADIGALAPRGSIADVSTHSEVAYRFYEEGLRAYYRGDQLGARGLLHAALAEDSTLAMAAYYLARSYQTGELHIEWIRRALRMAAHVSDRERLIIQTAWAVWTSDPAAIALADTLTVRYAQESEGHFYAAQARSEAGDHAEALHRMRQIVVTDSLALEGLTARCAACDARDRIVGLYLAMDSIPAAQREAQLWSTLQPDRATPWLRLAQMEALLGQTAAARSAYRRAAEIDPTLNGEPEFLAYRLVADGDYETLDSELREIVQSGSPERQLRARWFLIISLRHQGRFAWRTPRRRPGGRPRPVQFPARRQNGLRSTRHRCCSSLDVSTNPPHCSILSRKHRSGTRQRTARATARGTCRWRPTRWPLWAIRHRCPPASTRCSSLARRACSPGTR